MEREEKVRELAELKKLAELKIKELEAEIKLLKACLEIIDKQLSMLSFKPAIEVESKAIEEPYEREYTLTSRRDQRPLGKVYVWKDKLKIVPERGVHIKVERPPFSTFFIRRVLEEFRRKDLEAVERGELTPDEVLHYDIKEEQGLLKELTVYNYRNEIRLREIRNSVRWTFEKMIER